MIKTMLLNSIIIHNPAKYGILINNPAKFLDIIKEQEKDMKRTDKNYNAYAVFKKILNTIITPDELKGTDYGLIKVEYSKGRNSNGISRWYSKLEKIFNHCAVVLDILYARVYGLI
jgi:hypothetical protein